MDKLYPIIKRAKTCCGHKTNNGVSLAYCPVCNKRLSMKKVHPKYGCPLDYERLKAKNGNGLAGKPVHCASCGSLIHPLS